MQQDGKDLTWKILNTPNYTQEQINSKYFAHRATLPLRDRHLMDIGREGRMKTLADLQGLGII